MTAIEPRTATAAQFSVQRDDLIRELGIVAKAASHRSTIPILSNVLFRTDGNRIRLAASDLEISIQSCIDGAVEQEGSFCLPAKRLLEYVRALPDGQILFKVGANHWVSIAAARSKSRIAGMSAENFPELLTIPGEPTLTLPAKDWAAITKRTTYAISKEESRFTLSGALLVHHEGHPALVATDGHRLCMGCTEQAVEAFKRIIIPVDALAHLSDLAGDVSLYVTDGGLFFSAGDRTLIAPQLTGSFPDYERVVPKDYAGRIEVNRFDLLEAMRRVIGFSDERSRAVRLSVKQDALLIESSVAETGEASETLEASVKGPELQVGLNGKYLIEYLGSVDAAMVQMDYISPDKAVRFSCDELGYCVLMPMRL